MLGGYILCDDECLRASRRGEICREPMESGFRLLAGMLSAYEKFVAALLGVMR